MGNRLQRQDSAAGTTNSQYNAANMLTATTGTGASSYTSDADGDTLSGGGRTMAWDSQNRMVSCLLNKMVAGQARRSGISTEESLTTQLTRVIVQHTGRLPIGKVPPTRAEPLVRLWS